MKAGNKVSNQLREQYTAVMKKYDDEGAVKIVRDKELITLNPILFLPHHADYHPKKPNEARIDCAFKCDGMSLNHKLFQGPTQVPLLAYFYAFELKKWLWRQIINEYYIKCLLHLNIEESCVHAIYGSPLVHDLREEP